MMKKRIRKCGIYKITCIPNDVVYVGQARDIIDRWSDHKKELNGQYHGNIHLQRAWNKYGAESFSYDILEECSISELNDKEIYWIKELNTFKNGFNQDSGGKAGREISDEYRQRLSDSHKGKKPSLEAINKIAEKTRKKVFNFRIETGEIVEYFNSCLEASEKLNIDSTNITKCCNRKQRSASGFGWLRLSDIDKLSETLEELRSTCICCIDKDTRKILKFYNTSQEASDNFTNGTVHKINCHMRNKTLWENMYWMRYSNYKKWKEETLIG